MDRGTAAAPGIRAGTERSSSRVFAEPRLSARFHLGAFAISGSLDRSFQFLSVLRDDRYFAPGAPMWFLRKKGQPVSVADGISVALDYWRGKTWTASATGWTRRSSGMPSWHPESLRDLSALEYHDGTASGWEVSLEKHVGLLRGWFSYHRGSVQFRDTEANEYRPRWGFLSVPNITGRANVLTYSPASVPTRQGNYMTTKRQIPLFPFIGVDFRF